MPRKLWRRWSNSYDRRAAWLSGLGNMYHGHDRRSRPFRRKWIYANPFVFGFAAAFDFVPTDCGIGEIQRLRLLQEGGIVSVRSAFRVVPRPAPNADGDQNQHDEDDDLLLLFHAPTVRKNVRMCTLTRSTFGV